MSAVSCSVCPRSCRLEDGKTGWCRARRNVNGKIESINYGLLTALALDPVEKKPLYRFMPGSKVLSLGSFGCNLDCPFCQNDSISAADDSIAATLVSPQELVQKALDLKPRGNIGLAYTYNEPLIGIEYVRDCSRLAHEAQLKNVIVTNGFINEAPLKELLPFIDAINIDLKAFNEQFYKNIGGDLNTVKRSIKIACQSCHVEVTTLIIPNENDSPAEMREMSEWLASVNKDIPLHISRFFPRYRYADRNPTNVDDMRLLATIARGSLNHVYLGNC